MASAGPRTSWRIRALDDFAAERRGRLVESDLLNLEALSSRIAVTLTVASDDPVVAELIEDAAARAHVHLERINPEGSTE